MPDVKAAGNGDRFRVDLLPTLTLSPVCPLLKELEAARLRSVSAADVAALKSRTELLNGQKASLLSEMNAMVRLVTLPSPV